MDKIVYHNWTDTDLRLIEEKTTYTELVEVGISILKHLFKWSAYCAGLWDDEYRRERIT